MRSLELIEAALTGSVVGAFYDVYNDMDFGFLEHIYKNALEKELVARGHRVDREVRVVVYYKGEPIAVQIIDMVVDGKVLVEIKAAAEMRAAWTRQLQNHLRATDLEVGLLLHFGLKPKFYRLVELRSRKAQEERKSKADTDLTDFTGLTDCSSAVGAPHATTEEGVEMPEATTEKLP